MIDDALAVPNHAAAYRDAVEQAGNADLLVQTFTNGVGHCAFTTQQDVAAIAAMAYSLDTGMRPDNFVLRRARVQSGLCAAAVALVRQLFGPAPRRFSAR